jgi:hypothetical protein
MANYASKDTLIELTDGADALKDISAAVRTINGITIEALTQESHGFGKTWLESLFDRHVEGRPDPDRRLLRRRGEHALDAVGPRRVAPSQV